jgi:hypothetical protein
MDNRRKKEIEERENNFPLFNRWLRPFPSNNDQQIQLSGSKIILWSWKDHKIIDLNDRDGTDKERRDYEKFENTAEERKNNGENAPNSTNKWNFYISLRVLLSALDRSVCFSDKDWECKFKLEKLKDVYEGYREIFKKHIKSHSFDIDYIGNRMKSSVNALLRRASVWEDWNQCIQVDRLLKQDSPKNETGWYIIKKMKKFTRSGGKVEK